MRSTNFIVGINGPAEQVVAARRWLERCGREIPVLGEANLLKKPFPGFPEAFHKGLIAPGQSLITLSSDVNDDLEHAL